VFWQRVATPPRAQARTLYQPLARTDDGLGRPRCTAWRFDPGLRRQLIVENNAKPHPFRDRGYHPLATADLNDLVRRQAGRIDQPVCRRSA
jgi:hypothetical protein